MTDRRFTATFRGVRGSHGCPDPHTLHYGGHTSCIEIAVDDHHRVLLDAGTGLTSVAGGPGRFDVLLTHYHWDHLQGLPFFGPLYDAGAHFTFHGFPVGARPVRDLLETAIAPPWFPVPLTDTGSSKEYVDLTGAPHEVGPLVVRTARLVHPQGVTAYRLEHLGGAMVLATDVECGDEAADRELVALCGDADVIVHDAQYKPDEMDRLRGRGHSSWQQAVDIAQRAGARRLILFHHDPARTDSEIDTMVEAAAREFPEVTAAREGTSFTF